MQSSSSASYSTRLQGVLQIDAVDSRGSGEQRKTGISLKPLLFGEGRVIGP